MAWMKKPLFEMSLFLLRKELSHYT